MRREVCLYHPGIVPYLEALGWQQKSAASVAGGGPEALAILQHPPVYTLGRRADPDHVLFDAEALARRGAEVVRTDRGGDVTFHGPGQLVAYPILNLRAHNLAATDYVRLLEEVMLETVACFGITAQRIPGLPGVWSAGRKLGGIGVRVQHGVTTHGLALNVNLDLSFFDAIVPCGLHGIEVTSMARLLDYDPNLTLVEDTMLEAFEEVLECNFDLPIKVAAHTRRVRMGAAHARGARGVAPRNLSSLGVGAEQRESDAQQTWQVSTHVVEPNVMQTREAIL